MEMFLTIALLIILTLISIGVVVIIVRILFRK
jgi:hypothetical protein